jgi:uncharacterized glyoxalase superfamily protein PhnB
MDFLKRTEQEDDFLRNAEREAIEPLIMHAQMEKAAGQLIIRDPFDPAPLVDLFKQYHHEIDKMANMAQSLKVTDDASNANATMLTTQAKQIEKAIEKKRVELKEPYLRVTSVLDSETKNLKDRLVQVQKYINGLIAPFLQKKENERREIERKAKEEAAKIQAELDAKAEADRKAAADEARLKALEEGKSKAQANAAAHRAASLVEDAPTFVTEAPAELKIQTESGSAKLKEEWDFLILNPMMLPEAAFIARFEQVVAALKPWVSAQMKAGIREISGCKIYKVAKLKTATKRDYKTYDKF